MTDPTRPEASQLRRWPSDPALLVDTTRCPACFAQLHRTVCDTCGLRLDVPAAAGLLAAGTRVRDAENARQSLISHMRAEQAAAAARAAQPTPAVPAAPPTAAVPAPAPAAAPAPAFPVAAPVARAVTTPTTPATAVPTMPAPPERPRRSGVQVLLLTLGIVLLSVAAIVFLSVAYIFASFGTRSIIIAAASIVVLALAWLLRARGLPGTAEGIAALAVVLLLLDVWIIRENSLFLSDRIDAPGYWGGALLLLAALLAGARRVSRVRVPGIAAAVLAPIGLAVFVYGIVPRGETATGVWLGGIAVLLAGAAARFGRPSIERAILVWAGLTGGTTALVAAPWALEGVRWSPTWALLGIAGGWLVMVVALRMRSDDAWAKAAPFAAAVVGLAAAAAPALGAAVELESREWLWVAPASAGAVACIAAAATRLRGRWARDALSAFIASASVAAVAAIPALAAASAFAAPLTAAPFSAWSIEALEPREIVGFWFGQAGDLGLLDDTAIGAVLAPLALGVAAAIALALLGRLRRLAAVPGGLLLGAAVAAAVTAPTLLGVVAPLVAIALVGLVLAALRPIHRVPGAIVVLASYGMASAAVAWAVSFGSAGLWWWTVVTVTLLAVAGRVLANRIWSPRSTPGLGVAHVVAASVIVILAAVVVPEWAEATERTFAAPWDRAAFVVGVLGSLVLVAVALVPRLVNRDRLAIAVPMLAAGLIAAMWDAVSGATLGWVPATALVIVGVLWLRTPIAGMRVAFATTTPVLLGFAVSGIVTEYGRADFAVLGVAGAALLAAGFAHVLLPREAPVKILWSAAVGIVALQALPSSLFSMTDEQTWLALLILAPVPLLVAALFGDPIAGASPARYLSWVSLALVVGAVWSRLASGDVREVEPYTLSLAAALAAAGALLMWRREAGATTAAGRTAVLGAAAAIAVLPSVLSAGGSELRTLVLVAAGSVAVLAGLFLPERTRGVPLRLLAVVAGWTAVAGAALVRGTAVAFGEPSALIPEFWPLLALAVGVLAAVAWAQSGARPETLAEWGLAASVTIASIPILASVLAREAAELRATLLFGALAVVHVASVAFRARPIAGPVSRWTSLGVMGGGGLIVLAARAVDPFDLVTVPIGAALLAAGAIRMARTATLRSWPALGPGLAVLLVPALIADWADPQLWRIVALGIAAVVAVVIGVVLRLQAPLLLGGSVLLVHALTQLWPWISRLYQADFWWVWLALAGALLVAIAATYERQVRLARRTVRTIASLR